jgi:hypothetical protein
MRSKFEAVIDILKRSLCPNQPISLSWAFIIKINGKVMGSESGLIKIGNNQRVGLLACNMFGIVWHCGMMCW